MQKAHRRRSADNRLALRFRQTSNPGPWIAGAVGASALLGLLFLMNSGKRESLHQTPQAKHSKSISSQGSSPSLDDSTIEATEPRDREVLSGTNEQKVKGASDPRSNIEGNLSVREHCPMCDGSQVLTGDFAKKVNSALKAVAVADESNRASLAISGEPLSESEKVE